MTSNKNLLNNVICLQEVMDIKTEKLYLAQGGTEDIFVEKCPKQQHVVDGIRFLYRQYVKV